MKNGESMAFTIKNGDFMGFQMGNPRTKRRFRAGKINELNR